MNFDYLQCIESIKPYDALAWIIILSAAIIFWRWHLDKNNQFNLADLVCENGKLDANKFLKTGSWLVMSYGFYLLSKESPQNLVAYAPLYGGIWVSAEALSKWQQNNSVSIGSTNNQTRTITENISLTPEEVEAKKLAAYSPAEN